MSSSSRRVPRVALDALNALEQLEDAMDEEARALYPRYQSDIQDYTLTFEHEYPERAELYNDKAPFLDDVIRVVEDIETAAAAAAPAAV